MTAAVETMMYAKQVPWHGLGTYVGDDPVLAEDAIKMAELDWAVEKCPAVAVFTDDDLEHEIAVDDWYFNVRDKDHKVLGAVQGRYKVLQNTEAFEFMDSLAGPNNLVRYHTAGSLHGGRHIWLLAEVVGLTIEPVKGDRTDPYLLLVNGHDGRMPLKALFTSVRVVCQNTLNLALSTAKEGITIRHTGDMQGKISEARKILGLGTQEFKKYSELADVLVAKTFKKADYNAFLDALVPLNPVKDDETDKANSRRIKVRETLVGIYEGGPGSDIKGVTGTAWGALQSVTNYTSHHRTARGAGKDENLQRAKRLESVWFHTGNKMNQQALKYLVEA